MHARAARVDDYLYSGGLARASLSAALCFSHAERVSCCSTEIYFADFVPFVKENAAWDVSISGEEEEEEAAAAKGYVRYARGVIEIEMIYRLYRACRCRENIAVIHVIAVWLAIGSIIFTAC